MNINAQDNERYTGLHYLAKRTRFIHPKVKRLEAINAFIENGADVSIRSFRGEIPCDLVKPSKIKDHIKKLLKPTETGKSFISKQQENDAPDESQSRSQQNNSKKRKRSDAGDSSISSKKNNTTHSSFMPSNFQFSSHEDRLLQTRSASSFEGL